MNAELILNYARGLASLGSSDVWLPSFPKTGSTWVRFLLCNAMLLTQEDDPPRVDFHVLDASMPALGHHSLLKPWPYEHFPRFVKTHQPYRRRLFARPGRTVYVLRDPRDVMVSYFHFQKAHTQRPFDGTFAQFVRHPKYGIAACLKHYKTWEDQITILVRYENLKRDARNELEQILRAANVPISAEQLTEAVARSEFSRVRDAQNSKGLSGKERFQTNFKFARSGKTGQWPEYFTAEDVDYYRTVSKQYQFDLYQAEESAPPSVTAEPAGSL